MPQSEEAAAWFAAVYQAVQEIPHGKVTSYGHIATLIGYRKSSSQTCKIIIEGYDS
jgi:methylated-DNA-protein-cysteine methyltransferase-like protein